MLVMISWNTIPTPDEDLKMEETVSVIIPVRNEEANIRMLLEDFQNQDYPQDRFNVIVMDDGSTDQTANIVNEITEKVSYSIIYVLNTGSYNNITWNGKKSMIMQAVGISKASIILQTDGDCRVGPKWISVLAASFKDPKIQFLTGPVIYKYQNGNYHQMLQMDLAGLIVSSAAMINLNLPVMASGACMAYRKETFEDLGGYKSNLDYSSGDDSFLMHAVSKNYPGSIKFIKNTEAVSYTVAPGSWTDFYNQRIRWAGKWNYHQNSTIKILAIFIFLVHLSFLAILFWAILSSEYVLLIFMLTARMLLEGSILASWYKLFKLKLNIPLFLLASLMYSFYAVFFGILANTSTFTWKGRKYNK